MDPSAFPTVATVIGFTPEPDSGPLVATLACPITTEEETTVVDQDSDVNAESTIAIETDDPVTKAIVDNIVGNSPTKKPVIKQKCDICNILVIGKKAFEMHLNGSKHFKKMKLVESLAKTQEQTDLNKNAPLNPSLCFKCEICNVSVNSIQQLQLHSQGVKHNNNVAKLTQKPSKKMGHEPLCFHAAHAGVAAPRFPHATSKKDIDSALQHKQHETSRKKRETFSNKAVPSFFKRRYSPYSQKEMAHPDNSFGPSFRPNTQTIGAAGVQSFSCSACNVNVNSATQLQEHEASKKHAEKVSGHLPFKKADKEIKNPNERPRSKPGMSTRSALTEFRFLMVSGAAATRYFCADCNLNLNSANQLNTHLESRNHAERVAGNLPSSDKNIHSMNKRKRESHLNSQVTGPIGAANPDTCADNQYHYSDRTAIQSNIPQLNTHLEAKHTERASGNVPFNDKNIHSIDKYFRKRELCLNSQDTGPAAKRSFINEENDPVPFADLREKPIQEDILRYSDRRNEVAKFGLKCNVCNVHTNSMAQLEQHYNSRKHIKMLEGEPSNVEASNTLIA